MWNIKLTSDIPGLSDVNQTRVQNTQRYLRDIDFCFLVAPIERVQTDSLVHERLNETFRLFETRKALICTKIDVRVLDPALQIVAQNL